MATFNSKLTKNRWLNMQSLGGNTEIKVLCSPSSGYNPLSPIEWAYWDSSDTPPASYDGHRLTDSTVITLNAMNPVLMVVSRSRDQGIVCSVLSVTP